MLASIAALSLTSLFVAGLFRTVRLPGLLGMLLVGVLFGPYFFDLLHPKLMTISPEIRTVALILILLRAGLGLRRDSVARVGWTALLMAVVPVTLEGAMVAWLGHRLLAMPLWEALLLACVVVAVSPAVVVPFMLAFIERRLGTAKAIPSLVLTAAALEDVFVIILFTLLLGMQGHAEAPGWWSLAAIPKAMLFGVLAGALIGFGLHHLFKRYALALTEMTLTLLAVAMALTWVETFLRAHLPLSALLGILTVGFILLDRQPAAAHAMARQLSKVWVFAEILLYVLVGAQLNVPLALKAGLLGLLLVASGLVVRSIATWFCVGGLQFNAKERLFCVVAYLPKATVQATLAAIPLEYGVASGEKILAVAVLAIVFSAPLGAIGLSVAGPRCLQKEHESTGQTH